METEFAIDLLLWQLLLPAGISVACLFLLRLFLPDRWATSIAFCGGFFTAYCFLEWAKVIPERHFMWIPWITILCLIPAAISLAEKIGVFERLTSFIPISAATAWFVMPTWSRLEDDRVTLLFGIGVTTWLLCIALELLARRMSPAWFLFLMTTIVGGTAATIMPFMSLKFGEIVMCAAGASAGVFLLNLKAAESQSARAMVPFFAIVLTTGVFISYVELDPAQHQFPGLLTAPVVLIPFVIGPLREQNSIGIKVAQVVLILAVLGGVGFWLYQSEPEEDEWANSVGTSELIVAAQH